MTHEEHKQRHAELNQALDELVADFITQTGKIPSQTTVMELMTWAHDQMLNPTDPGKGNSDN